MEWSSRGTLSRRIRLHLIVVDALVTALVDDGPDGRKRYFDLHVVRMSVA